MDTLASVVLMCLGCVHLLIVSVNGDFLPCDSPNGSVGSCKPLVACTSLYNLATKDRQTENEIDFLRRSQCGVANNRPLVCCAEVQNEAFALCQTPIGDDGDCKPLTDCQPLYNVALKKDIAQEEIEFLRNSKCGYEVDSTNVCCPKLKTVQAVPKPKVRTSSDENTDVVTCKTPNGLHGECIAIDDCSALSYLFEKEQLTEAELLFVRRSECEGGETQICCPKAITVDDELETTKAVAYHQCLTSFEKVGECMPIQNCSVMMNIVLKANKTQAEIAFLQANQCGYDNKIPFVCCPQADAQLQHAIGTTAKFETGIEAKNEVPANKTCVTPNGAFGECIALENCNSIFELYQRESLTQEELKYLRECECESANVDEVRVCCPKTLNVVELVQGIATHATSAPLESTKCQTPNEVSGICISIIHCKPLMDIIQKHDFLESDIRYLRASFCADADRFPIVCCPDISATEDAILPMPPYCGRVSTENNTNDAATTTHIDEYPWTALLIYTNPRGQLSFPCGGTLIHERFVLTAAHCLEEVAGISKLSGVRLGEWATQVSEDCQSKNPEDELCSPPHLDVAVEKFITHPEYNSTNNDLALLRLAKVVSFTRFISPICLPFGTSSSLRGYPLEGATMYAAGWGAKRTSETSSLKMKSSLTLQNFTACLIQYSTIAGINLTDRHICAAGNSAADSIIIDSGGALMSLTEIGKVQSYFLVGVHSLSYEYSLNRGFAGVYTHIECYLDWIRKEIKSS